jgi:uncharacterized protein (TIGR02391 family)
MEEVFSPELINMFRHPRPVRIVMNEREHFRSFLEILDEQKKLLEGFIREHERFAGTGEAVVTGTRPLGTYQLHQEIAKVSSNLFEDGHFAQAVEEAFKRVINEVKAHMVRKGQNIPASADSLMGHAFGIDNRLPHIKFNTLTTPEEEDEQRGLMYLFKGIVGIRNRKAHQNVILDSPERAAEYLALASLLMRLLDLSPQFDNP